MYARVVRFTDVDPDQRTAVVIQLFETADDMEAAEAPLAGMDPSATPGTRASVDRCEIKAEMSPGAGTSDEAAFGSS